MKNYTDAELFSLADKLDSIHTWLYDVPELSEEAEDALHTALDEAITLICPTYFDAVAKDLETQMRDPEIQKLVEETMRLPRAQEFIADVERVKRGEMTVEELEKKIHGVEG